MRARYPPIISPGIYSHYPLILKIFNDPVLVYNHGSQIVLKKNHRTCQRIDDSLPIFFMRKPLVFKKVFETNQNSRFFDSRIFNKPKVTVL
jgi:hypothetical protein